MRPLLVHASSPAERPTRRRVLHLELSRDSLPGGLLWHAHETPDTGTILVGGGRAFWPFAVSPTTAVHHEQRAFLDAALAKGLSPYFFDFESFGVASETLGRSVDLVHRGGSRRWEVCCYGGDHFRFILEGFARCGEAALAWLGGATRDEVVASARPLWRFTLPLEEEQPRPT